VYTPRGEKLFMFPLRLDESAFSIDVVFAERQGTESSAIASGSTIIVSGELAGVSGKPHDKLRLMANKIIRMEE